MNGWPGTTVAVSATSFAVTSSRPSNFWLCAALGHIRAKTKKSADQRKKAIPLFTIAGWERQSARSFPPVGRLFLALVVVGFLALGDDLFGPFLEGDPLPAVGIITGVAARVIRDHVVDEVFVVRGRELMRLARGEEK